MLNTSPDVGAYESFVREHIDALGLLAGALARDRDDAADVLSEALVRMWQAWPSVSSAANPVAYARKTVVNAFIDHKRAGTRRLSLASRLKAGAPRDAVNPSYPSDQTGATEEQLMLLPRKQRAALVLRYYLDLDSRSIAEYLGCSDSAARTYISRGLTVLRQMQPPAGKET